MRRLWGLDLTFGNVGDISVGNMVTAFMTFKQDEREKNEYLRTSKFSRISQKKNSRLSNGTTIHLI